MSDEKRKFERHGLDIPIVMKLGDVVYDNKEYLNDIGIGGLSFKSSIEVALGSIIEISIPLVRPIFEAKGKVVWCRKAGNYFDVGVNFTEVANSFRIRMVEQICHIEKYKKELSEKEERKVSGEEAALDWIKKYAQYFPGLSEYEKDNNKK